MSDDQPQDPPKVFEEAKPKPAAKAKSPAPVPTAPAATAPVATAELQEAVQSGNLFQASFHVDLK